MNDIEIIEPSIEGKKPDDFTIESIGVPAEWEPYILNGLTMVRFRGPTSSTDIPYHVDYVWEQNIRFTYFGSKGIHRAMYILRPAAGSAWVLDNDINASLGTPLIAGVLLKHPGIRVLKMQFATFTE